jgi:acyl-CoA thioester hydrolase
MTASRNEFKTWLPIATRWEDVDVYGHVNNVKYYAYFDTVINEFLVREGGLTPSDDAIVGYVVESRCTFSSPIHFPEIIDAGLAVEKIGRSSVTYRIGLFGAADDKARAVGNVVHVFVDRKANQSVEIPAPLRSALASLQ